MVANNSKLTRFTALHLWQPSRATTRLVKHITPTTVISFVTSTDLFASYFLDFLGLL